MSNTSNKIEVILTQVIRRVEVTMQESGGKIHHVTVHEAGGGGHQVTLGSPPDPVPWSALTSIPANLCLATVAEDGLTIEFRDLAGHLISKAPYLP